MLQDSHRRKFNNVLCQTFSIVVLQDDESLGGADSSVHPPALMAKSFPGRCWAHSTSFLLRCCYREQQAKGQPGCRAWFLAWVRWHQHGCNPTCPAVFSPLLSLFSLLLLLPSPLLPCASGSAKWRGVTWGESTM